MKTESYMSEIEKEIKEHHISGTKEKVSKNIVALSNSNIQKHQQSWAGVMKKTVRFTE